MVVCKNWCPFKGACPAQEGPLSRMSLIDKGFPMGPCYVSAPVGFVLNGIESVYKDSGLAVISGALGMDCRMKGRLECHP